MKVLTRKPLLIGAGIIGFDALVFATTNATKVAAYTVMVGFVALGLTLWAANYGVLSLLALYGVKLKRKRRKALYLSLLLSGLVALQSIGELSAHDLYVLTPMLFIGYGYSTYTKANRQNFQS